MNLIEQTKKFVKGHKHGGGNEEDALCNADCLSLVKGKAVKWAKKCKTKKDKNEIHPVKSSSKDEVGKVEFDRIKRKMKHVYDRIITKELKEVANKWHNEALNILN